MNELGTIKNLGKDNMKIQVNLVVTDLLGFRDHSGLLSPKHPEITRWHK